MEKRIAILATDGFEQSELLSPKETLENEGWTAEVVSLKTGEIKSWKDGNWGDSVVVDRTVSEANASDYDALVLPGGVINPDLLRVNEDAVAFVKAFFDEKKPVAAICHGPWTLINADVVSGREMTSYQSIRKDLENAGAIWTDAEVVVDQGLVTSRSPQDLPAFNRKMVEEIKEGVHARM
ncbi:Cysteine protease YraA [Flavobacterium longum]|uniref:type 1 glutamine amidotransferase domain-containing protein n=1 Tax=Flavobacterium longum TaxID=1299340 RepID=UPI0039E99429